MFHAMLVNLPYVAGILHRAEGDDSGSEPPSGGSRGSSSGPITPPPLGQQQPEHHAAASATAPEATPYVLERPQERAVPASNGQDSTPGVDGAAAALVFHKSDLLARPVVGNRCAAMPAALAHVCFPAR